MRSTRALEVSTHAVSPLEICGTWLICRAWAPAWASMAARWTSSALTAVSAALSASPVRIRITRSSGWTKILPSPTSPVRAEERMAWMVGSTNGSDTAISIFTFSWNSATTVLPRYCSITSRSPPWPVTRLSVIPVTPARNNAAFTSGRRSGRTIVVMRRIVVSPCENVAQRRRPLRLRERARESGVRGHGQPASTGSNSSGIGAGDPASCGCRYTYCLPGSSAARPPHRPCSRRTPAGAGSCRRRPARR